MNESSIPPTTTGRGDANPDPITGAPGSHPVGTGVGAAGGGATGAAIGATVGGPVGAVVGAAVGAVVGGMTGKGVAEAIDPTAEDAYWRGEHSRQPFASGSRFEDYQPAYRAGYEGYGRYGGNRAFGLPGLRLSTGSVTNHAFRFVRFV